VLADLEALAGSPGSIADIPSMASRLAGDDEDDLVSGLDVLEGLLRDASRSSLGSAALVHVDRLGRLEALGRRLGPQCCAALVGSIERLRSDLRFHVNRALVAESLLAAVAGGPVP
jgi:hypothetical protein